MDTLLVIGAFGSYWRCWQYERKNFPVIEDIGSLVDPTYHPDKDSGDKVADARAPFVTPAWALELQETLQDEYFNLTDAATT